MNIDSAGKEHASVSEFFRSGTELSHAFNLYVFDKHLRLLFLDALERIEVALRVDIALLLGRTDPWAHRNPSNFNRYFRSVDPGDLAVRHLKWLSYLDALASRSREEFVQHFTRTYRDPLPIWISIELWDFGTLSALVSGMKAEELHQLASRYQLPRRTMLISWVDCLNYVRNLCAHHGRLWNRALVVQPAPARRGEIPLLSHWSLNEQAKKRVYAAAAVMQFLLRILSPGSTWGERLKACIAGFPVGPGLNISAAGFPEAWSEEQLWQRDERDMPVPADRS